MLPRPSLLPDMLLLGMRDAPIVVIFWMIFAVGVSVIVRGVWRMVRGK